MKLFSKDLNVNTKEFDSAEKKIGTKGVFRYYDFMVLWGDSEKRAIVRLHPFDKEYKSFKLFTPTSPKTSNLFKKTIQK